MNYILIISDIACDPLSDVPVFYHTSGTITLPPFVANKSQVCHWKIVAPMDHVSKTTFSYHN